MNFESRVAKEMTEGIVKAILEDAGYRVIDSGIEKVIRELSCLSGVEYKNLNYPDAMSRLPDFTVMNQAQTEKYLVEVKYRSHWGKELFDSMREQVRLFEELVLVSINAEPDNKLDICVPSTYLRCCRLRYQNDTYQIQMKYENDETWNHYWRSFNDLVEKDYSDDKLWWGMSPLEKVFTELSANPIDSQRVLFSAIKALSGILN